MIGALLAALLYVVAFPPLDLGIVGFVALAPWIVVARRWSGWRLFLAGSLVGALLLTMGCWWIHCTAPVNLAFMVVPESLFFGAFACLLRRLAVVQAWPTAIALPLAFTSIELARGRVPLDGFPWLTLGYTQHAHLGVVQLATVTGVHGVSFLLALCSGLIADAAAQQGARRHVRWLAAVALASAAELGGRLALGDADALPAGPRCLVVQPNLPQRLKMDSESDDEILRRNLELGEALLERQAVDLVIWSETMLPGRWRGTGVADSVPQPDMQGWRRELHTVLDGSLFQRRRVPLLVGAVTYEAPIWKEGSTPPFNSALLFDRSGNLRASYDKRVCVPGGEYLPWIDHFPTAAADSIRSCVRAMAGFLPNLVPGRRSGVFDLASCGVSEKLGVSICFEIAYPDVGRVLVAEGADFLVNLSNEAWFPDSAEFDQYTAMAVFRAAEVRRSLVRCANSGTSGSIDPWGRPALLERGGRRDGFAAATVVVPRISHVVTLYARFGEWLGWCVVAATATLLLIRWRRTALPVALRLPPARSGLQPATPGAVKRKP